jgi:integral membrane protein
MPAACLADDTARRVRSVALMGAVEATTYLVLLAATIWHVVGGPGLQRPLGLTHGIAFLVYAGTVVRARALAGWGSRTTTSLLLASIVPGGGFVAPRRLIDVGPTQ